MPEQQQQQQALQSLAQLPAHFATDQQQFMNSMGNIAGNGLLQATTTTSAPVQSVYNMDIGNPGSNGIDSRRGVNTASGGVNTANGDR